ncbi:hypothetical protein ACTXQV_74505, partial [Klebsiella pneumoniae]
RLMAQAQAVLTDIDGHHAPVKMSQQLMNLLSLKAAIKVKRYSSWRGALGETADNVLAAQALGVSDRQIILRHMLPNA